MLTDNIILIGPHGAGKSTLAKFIAKKLKWHYYSLDIVRNDRYIKEYSFEVRNEMHRWEISSPNWQKYNIVFVERFLREYAESDENCVLELGAGHSVYRDSKLFNRIKKLFAPYPNIVLILPSEQVEESLELLLRQINNDQLKRGRTRDEQINKDNRFFLEHSSNSELAKFIVYTKGKTPNETCEEICKLIFPAHNL